MTEYREIDGFPGYKVDDKGSVISSHRWRRDSIGTCLGTWYALKPYVDRCGYNVVTLYNGDMKRRVFAHILMLEAFVGPCPLDYVAAHGNGVPNDNRLENLRWTTQTDNLADRERHGTLRRGVKNTNSKLTDITVNEARWRHYRGEGVAELAREYKVDHRTMSAVIKYETWTHVPVTPLVKVA